MHHLFCELGINIFNWVSQYIAVMFHWVFQNFQLGIHKIIFTFNYLLFTPKYRSFSLSILFGTLSENQQLFHFIPNLSSDLLYPRHLCRGVYSFRLSIRDSVLFVKLLLLVTSFTLKFLKWGISHQPLIRKHSYLDLRYPWGSAFSPWLLTPGFMPQGGARGQNLEHL